MLEKLKQNRLVGLTLAIAGGLVLAHIVNRAGDHFYDYYPDVVLRLLTLAVLAVPASLLVRLLLRKYGVRRVTTGTIASLLIAGAVILAVTSIAAYRTRKTDAENSARAERERQAYFHTHRGATEADYDNFIVQQMLNDGSLPDKPENPPAVQPKRYAPIAIPSDDAAIAQSIDAYTQRELRKQSAKLKPNRRP